MLVRPLLAALVAFVAVIALPGVAHATVASGNSVGSYSCNAYGTGDSRASWTCTVRDKACDGRNVYVQIALANSNVMSGWTRGTSNTRGCGSTVKSTNSSSWSGRIDYVYFRVCKDIPRGYDTCYSSTERRDS